jgi:hypothetical protein
LRDQGEAVGPAGLRFGVHTVAPVGLAVGVEGDDLIDPHGVDELAVSGTLLQVGPARPGDPVAFLGQLDDVPLAARPELALRQRAEPAERVWGEPEVVVHYVGVEFGDETT